MKTVLRFDTHNAVCLPPELHNDDVRFSDSFAEYFIKQYTNPGDTVFDPFAGFGTALFAAERLGRRALGVEILPERAAFISRRLTEPNSVICGSALCLDWLRLPEIDFSLTSPPYMQRINHPEYPFAGYKVTGQTYNDYMRDIVGIYARLKTRLKPGAYAVVEVSNIVVNGVFTPLAWDIAKSVGTVLSFTQEIIVEWASGSSPAYGFGYDHSYALIFKNGGPL